MHRSISRSTPYLPRYQSVSPSRSPHLGSRRFSSPRSTSQPSQRIVYIDNAPSRVINSYHVHHSPSPNRTYRIHLCSTKTKNHLTRVTRSHSACDINSSHVYTSQEEIFVRSFKESTLRQVGSSEDIYHAAPFFPDVTPSESGVSFGDWEEGSTFGGEDDNVSQHSFGSSSAFCEVTADSELDKCDSDNFSGPDYIGDRALSILPENDSDTNFEVKKRRSRRSNDGLDSRDYKVARSGSDTKSRKKEPVSSQSWDYNKFHTQPEALSVIIPENEISGKINGNLDKVGSRGIGSTPLAHSTPHVSPGGPGESKLCVMASWDADAIGEAITSTEPKTSTPARPLPRQGSDTRNSSRFEDSSCNSSCSEDNYSDISNVTTSSPIIRKTKLVKKHSDKPLSSKKSLESHGVNQPDFAHARTVESERDQQQLNSASDDVKQRNDRSAYTLNDRGVRQDQQKLTTDKSDNAEQTDTSTGGNEWWASYNISTTAGHKPEVISREGDTEKSLAFRRVSAEAKPLAVNIPLITAGKHGQEKLRKLSQMSPPLGSPTNGSPPVFPNDTPNLGEHEKLVAQHLVTHAVEEERHVGGPVKSDNIQNHKWTDSEAEDSDKQPLSSNVHQDLTKTSCDTTKNRSFSVSEVENPTNGEIFELELFSGSLPSTEERVHDWHKKVSENARTLSYVTEKEGVIAESREAVEIMKLEPDNLSLHTVAVSTEPVSVANIQSSNAASIAHGRSIAENETVSVTLVPTPVAREDTYHQIAAQSPVEDDKDSTGETLDQLHVTKHASEHVEDIDHLRHSTQVDIGIPGSQEDFISKQNNLGDHQNVISLEENETSQDKTQVLEYMVDTTPTPSSESTVGQQLHNGETSSGHVASSDDVDAVSSAKNSYARDACDSNSCDDITDIVLLDIRPDTDVTAVATENIVTPDLQFSDSVPTVSSVNSSIIVENGYFENSQALGVDNKTMGNTTDYRDVPQVVLRDVSSQLFVDIVKPHSTDLDLGQDSTHQSGNSLPSSCSDDNSHEVNTPSPYISPTSSHIANIVEQPFLHTLDEWTHEALNTENNITAGEPVYLEGIENSPCDDSISVNTATDKAIIEVFNITDKEVLTTTDKKIFTPTDKEIIITTDKKVFTPTDKEIFITTEKKVFTPTDKEVFTTTEKKVFTPIDKEIFTTTDKKVFTPTDKEIFTTTDKKVFTSTDKEVFAPTDKEILTTTDKKVFTSTDKEVLATTDKELLAPIDKKVLTPTDKEIFTTTDKKIFTTTDKKVFAPTDKETFTTTDKKVFTSTDKEVLATTDKKIFAPIDKETFTTTDKGVFTTDKKAFTPTDTEIFTTTEKVITPTDKKVFTTTNKEVFTTTDKKVFTPTDKDIVITTDNKIFTPTDKKVFTSTDKKVFTPTDKEIFTTTDKKIFTTTDKKVFAPTDKETFTTTDKKVFTSTDKEVLATTDKKVFAPIDKKTFTTTDKGVFTTDKKAFTPTDTEIFTTTDKVITPTDKKVFTTTNKEVFTTTDKKVFTPTDKDIVITTDNKIFTPTDKEIFTTTDKKIFTPTDKEVFTSTDKETFTPTDKEVFTSTDKKVFTPTDKEIFTTTDKEVFTPTDKEVFTPTDKKVFAPTDKVTFTTTDKKVFTPTDKDIVITTDNKIFTPTDKKVFTSTDKKVFTPTDKEIFTTTDKKIFTPTDKEVFTSTDKEIFTPTDKGVFTSTDKKVFTPTDKEIFTTTDKEVFTSTDKVFNSTVKKVFTPTDKEIFTTTDNKVFTATDKEIFTTTDKKAFTPTDKQISITTDKEVPITTDKEILTRVDRQIFTAADQEILTTPDKDTCLTTDKDYIVVTQQESCSEISKQNTISTETKSGDTYLPVSSTAASGNIAPEITFGLSHPALAEQVTIPPSTLSTSCLDTEASFTPSSSSVSSSGLAVGTSFPSDNFLTSECDQENVTETASGLDFAYSVSSPVTSISKLEAEETFDSTAHTLEVTMHPNSPLDKLQAQLALLSGDTGLDIHVDRVQHQARTEEPDDFQNIAHVDACDFVDFSKDLCRSVDAENFPAHTIDDVVSRDELDNSVKVGVKSNAGSHDVKGCGDSDYDNVTTSMPMEPQLYTRPRHLHLLQFAHTKTSDLWALQEETESAMNTPSPKQPRVTFANEKDSNLHSGYSTRIIHHNSTEQNVQDDQIKKMLNGQTSPISDSSSVEKSKEKESTLNTAESNSVKFENGSEGICTLCEITSIGVTYDAGVQGNHVAGDESGKPVISPASTAHRETPEIQSGVFRAQLVTISPDVENAQVNFSVSEDRNHVSQLGTLTSNLGLSTNSATGKDLQDTVSSLDALSASLKQFNIQDIDTVDRKPLLLSNDSFSAPDSGNYDFSSVSAYEIERSRDEDNKASSYLPTHNFDLSHASTTETPTETNNGSVYTCTGTAEIKKTPLNDNPVNSPKTNFRPVYQKPVLNHKLTNAKIKQFEKILYEFNRGLRTSQDITDFLFFCENYADYKDSSASSSEELYKYFTNDDSEKVQNHTCITVEDEDMNTFRFKRYLKKSHSKRNNGRKILRFLSKLSCVSETLSSPTDKPNGKVKNADKDAHIFSTDSMTNPRMRISNPVLISSTSFQLHNILNSSPMRYDNNGNTSFDSVHTSADSAYSSLSEATLGSLSSPAFRPTPAASESVSSAFNLDLSTGDWTFPDNVFSNTSDAAIRTSFAKNARNQPDGQNRGTMFSLSDEFHHFNFSESEIDGALLNRLRYGHVQAELN